MTTPEPMTWEVRELLARRARVVKETPVAERPPPDIEEFLEAMWDRGKFDD